jgi:dienelactone hydrolase
MSVRTQVLTYAVGGVSMQSDLYFDDAATRPRPGIVVFPEAFGLSEHARGRARRLAEHGYVALAADYHGGAKLYQTLEEIIPLIGALSENPSRARDIGAAALNALGGRAEVAASQLAAIGYCFGGTMALELARSGAPTAATVGFHSGLGTAKPAEKGVVKGKVLACIGSDDPLIPPEQRADFEREMRAAVADWRLYVYGSTVHSFTNPDAGKNGHSEMLRYDSRSDSRSWGEMLALFEESFGRLD